MKTIVVKDIGGKTINSYSLTKYHFNIEKKLFFIRENETNKNICVGSLKNFIIFIT